jgi:hypothetical protein
MLIRSNAELIAEVERAAAASRKRPAGHTILTVALQAKDDQDVELVPPKSAPPAKNFPHNKSGATP